MKLITAFFHHGTGLRGVENQVKPVSGAILQLLQNENPGCQSSGFAISARTDT